MSARRASTRACLGASLRGAAGLALLVAAEGCYTTSNVATLAPLRTSYPVSASPQYVDGDGSIVTEEQYRVVAPFDFTYTVEGPRHDATATRIKLEPQLDGIVAKSRGDAVTHLRIDGDDYSSGSHGTAGGLKMMGWSFGVLGVIPLVLIPAAQNEDRDSVPTLAALGGASLGLGALFYLLGAYVADDPSVWRFHVTGNVVQRNAAPEAPALPPPPAQSAPPPASVPSGP